MASRAMYTGTEAIMDAFEGMDVPYYSVWQGKDLLFQFNDSDVEKGRVKLETMLQAAEQQQNTDILAIKFHAKPEKGGYITNSTKVVGTLFVRAYGLQNYGMTEGNTTRDWVPNPVYKHMEKLAELPELLVKMNERLIALETEDVEDVTPQPNDMVGRIGAILDNPQVMGLIEKFTPVVVSLLSKAATIFSPLPQQSIKLSGMSMSESNSQAKQPVVIDEQGMAILNNSLDRLANHCDLVTDLKALADMADNNPQMFAFLLTQLKQQK